VLLVTVGLFTLLAGPETITGLIQAFGHVMPQQATELLGNSLHRLDHHPSTTITITVVGLLLAIWSTTGAMAGYMTAVNIAYDREDRRPFIRKRLVALMMAACIGAAFLLVACLLMFGPQIEKRVGPALGAPQLVSYLWWAAQWPILVAGLLAAFGTLLHLGPDVDRRWRLVTPGALVAVTVWLAVSGLFAVYTAHFGTYDKTWGSLSAVIVMLTWLWLSALALLFGAEIDAQIDRGSERRSELRARVWSAAA
jgi:membrane protein